MRPVAFRPRTPLSRHPVASRVPVGSTCARKPKCPARSGPTHRLQGLCQTLPWPGWVVRHYAVFAPERLSPSIRERAPGGPPPSPCARSGAPWRGTGRWRRSSWCASTSGLTGCTPRRSRRCAGRRGRGPPVSGRHASRNGTPEKAEKGVDHVGVERQAATGPVIQPSGCCI